MEIKDKNDFKDFLKFKRMITPIIIQILFWVGVALCVFSGLFAMVQGELGSFLGGIVVLIVGPIVVRIYCEILILFFRMNETLTEISRNTCCKDGQGDSACCKEE
jgi:hypothetical protein